MKDETLTCMLCVGLLLASVAHVSGSPSPSGDLILQKAGHPFQVVIPYDVPLIAFKPAALELGVASTFKERVWVDIGVTYNFGTEYYVETGPDGNGVPMDPGVNMVYIPGGPASGWGPSGWDLDNPARLLGLEWTGTGNDVQIEVEVDPSDRIDETDEDNNYWICAGKQVVESMGLDVLVVPYGETSLTDLDLNMKFLQSIYPLGDGSLSWTTGDMRGYEPGMTDICDITSEAYYSAYVQDLSVEARTLGYDRLVVVTPDTCTEPDYNGIAIGMLRDPEDRVPVVVQGPVLVGYPKLVPHEIGHTYYLWHPHDLGPPVYDAERYNVIGRDYGDTVDTFMRWGQAGPWWIDKGRYVSDPKTWIDLSDSGLGGTWQWNLLEQFETINIWRTHVVVIAGFISSGSTLVNIDRPWYRVAKAVPDLLPTTGPPQEGNYTILLLNSNRQAIAQMSFNASFWRLVNGPEADMGDAFERQRLETIPFVFSVPFIEGTSFIQFQDRIGNIVAERGVTLNPPIVHVTFPNGGEQLRVGGRYTIAWEASDADGGHLSYLLAYSRDGGGNWIPIASDVADTHYGWDTSGLTPGDEYLVRVIATDGVNTGQDASDAKFTFLGPAPPVGGVVEEPTHLVLRNPVSLPRNTEEYHLDAVLSQFASTVALPLAVASALLTVSLAMARWLKKH